MSNIACQTKYADDGTYLYQWEKDSERWYPTEEYFKKKTKSEILQYGEVHNIFNDDKVTSYIEDTLNLVVGQIANFKKSELIRIFLESGVELTGKVPEEVLAD
jgi:ParB family transcriptional regulator, chromosome partitioning protein